FGALLARSDEGERRPYSFNWVYTRGGAAASNEERLGLLPEPDDAGRREAIDLLAREPELAEHLGGVLTEQRRGPIDARRSAGRAAGEREHLHFARAGLIHLGHVPLMARLRVLEHFVELVDRTRRDASGLEARDPFGGGAGAQDGLHPRLERGVVGKARRVIDEARIGLHGRIAERLAEAA